jgi:hypothetical protein
MEGNSPADNRATTFFIFKLGRAMTEQREPAMMKGGGDERPKKVIASKVLLKNKSRMSETYFISKTKINYCFNTLPIVFISSF